MNPTVILGVVKEILVPENADQRCLTVKLATKTVIAPVGSVLALANNILKCSDRCFSCGLWAVFESNCKIKIRKITI